MFQASARCIPHPFRAAKTAKILRANDTALQRTEVPIDVKSILAGKSNDLPLPANDILFMPTSAGKNAPYEAWKPRFQIGTGLAIYRF